MSPYADTNLFTRLYLPLPESAAADRLVDLARLGRASPLPVTWLLRLELVNAFQLHVFASRSHRQTRITREQAAAAHATFRGDLRHPTFLRQTELSLLDLELQFEELALRYTASRGFRTYDLIHVASALLLRCDTFWTFDPKASQLASLEGLKLR